MFFGNFRMSANDLRHFWVLCFKKKHITNNLVSRNPIETPRLQNCSSSQKHGFQLNRTHICIFILAWSKLNTYLFLALDWSYLNTWVSFTTLHGLIKCAKLTTRYIRHQRVLGFSLMSKKPGLSPKHISCHAVSLLLAEL